MTRKPKREKNKVDKRVTELKELGKKKVADHGIGTGHTLAAGNLKTIETFRYVYEYECEINLPFVPSRPWL